MKWGIRRYQNKDGSLTSAGKRRLRKNIGNERIDSTERKKVIQDKIDSLKRSKEYKEYTNLQKERAVAALTNKKGEVVDYLYSYIDLEHDPISLAKQQAKDTKIITDYNNFMKKLDEQYSDKFQSAVLKDFGMEDTKEAREYLKKKGLVV